MPIGPTALAFHSASFSVRRERRMRNAEAETRSLAEAEALEAALRQLELSTSRTEQTLDVIIGFLGVSVKATL